MSRWVSKCCWCLWGLCLGCGPQPAEKPPSKPASTAIVPRPAEASAEETAPNMSAGKSSMTVSIIDAEGLAAAVAKHPGKVVLVDCWATWCTNCMKQFPHTIAMSHKHAADGLVVMSLSFDDADDQGLAKVRNFLEKHDVQFENYISRLDIAGEAQQAFQIEGGTLPHYKIYARTGKLHKALNSDEDHAVTAEELEAEIIEALK